MYGYVSISFKLKEATANQEPNCNKFCTIWFKRIITVVFMFLYFEMEDKYRMLVFYYKSYKISAFKKIIYRQFII